MTRVIALQPLEHNGTWRRGDTFDVSPRSAELLVRRGLARAVTSGAVSDPLRATGGKLSASPVAPVSQRTTAKRSGRGAKAGQTGASSSLTLPTR